MMASLATEQSCYPMIAIPQGICIIINNVNFAEQTTDRPGSDVDAEKLNELFGSFLKFKVVSQRNVTLEKQLDILKTYQLHDHTGFDALIVIILSHGGTGDVIYTIDGNIIKINDIAKYFTASSCPSLSNKPKVFIIQACRGTERNQLQAVSPMPSYSYNTPAVSPGSTSVTSYDGRECSLSTAVITAPDESDTLYAYATIEDHTALRDTQNGSWFIQELVDVVKDHAHEKHLLEILTLVNDRVSHRVNENEVQVSQIKSTLRKRLFLLPQPLQQQYQSQFVCPRSSLPLIETTSERVATPPPLTKYLSMTSGGFTPHSSPRRRHTIASPQTIRKQPNQQAAEQRLSPLFRQPITTPSSAPAPCSVHSNEGAVLLGTHSATTPCPTLELISISRRVPLPSQTGSCNIIPDCQVAYKMNEDPATLQCYCIVINNNSSHYKEAQLVDIKKVFADQLRFHVQIYSDLTRKGMEQLLKAVASVDHTDLYCLVVIVISKGGRQRAIYGVDGKKLQVKDVMMLFSRDSCPSLANKPKLFVIDTQLDERGIIDSTSDEQWEIPDTYVASYFGHHTDEGRRFIPNVAHVVCNESVFKFQDGMDDFMSSFDHNETVFVNKLEKPLHFNSFKPTRSLEGLQKLLIEEIKLALKILSKMRRATLMELKIKRDDIFQICQNVRKIRMAGAVTSLAGGGLTIIGFGLIPVTLGGSLALSLLGAGVGMTGGAVSIASTVTDRLVSKEKLKKAQAIIEVDIQLTKQVNGLFSKLNKFVETAQEMDPRTSKEDIITSILQSRQLVRIGAVVTKTGTGGVQIARSAFQGSVFALKVVGPAARGVAVVGGVVTALTLPLDVYELVSNSIKLYKRSETEATKWFNEQLSLLQDQQEEVEQMIQELIHDHEPSRSLSMKETSI